ncbi:MAG: hypothetical protein ACR2L4_07855 [Actinomycetota bacterium]
MTRRRSARGFLKLSRRAMHDIDHNFPSLSRAVKYTYVRLCQMFDYLGTGSDDGSVFVAGDLADDMNDAERSIRRDLSRLADAGLVVWERAKNSERQGQMRLPFLDWTKGEEDAIGPCARSAPGPRPVNARPNMVEHTRPDVQEQAPKTLRRRDNPLRESLEQIRKAITEAFGIDLSEATPSERREVAKAAEELHKVTPDEVKSRAQRMRAKWPNAVPHTLVKYWTQFGDQQTNGKASSAYLPFMSPEWLAANPHWEEKTP